MEKKSPMVSIWESGIEYGNFCYENPTVSNTVYGFDGSDNKNVNQGDDRKKCESVKKKKDKSVKVCVNFIEA